MRKIYLSLFLGLWCLSGQSQISEGGTPPGFALDEANSRNGQTSEIPIVQVTPPNVLLLQQQDENNARKGKPYRVGTNLPVHYTVKNAGKWTALPDGGKLWRLTLQVPGAQALGLYYKEQIYLPQGSRLYLYNGNRKQVIGAYTAELNNARNPIHATEMLEGDATTLEYYAPAGVNEDPTIVISDVVYFYRGVEDHVKYFRDKPDQNQNKAQSCEVNVACSEANGWQDQVDGVVHYTFATSAGTYVCTGSLINNTAGDCRPFLLTADHCGERTSTSQFNTNVWYFKYENPNCAAGTTSQYPKPSTTMTGAIFRSSSRFGSHSPSSNQVAGSDFTLCELNSAPPASYSPYYVGWDRRNVAASSGVSIHHPAGHDKKISTFTNALSSATYNGGLSGAHWAVVWAPTANGHGVTEGGSSGSGIFNASKRLVGTLSGGSSYCSTPYSSDLYGKMYTHWDQLSSSANGQLKVWLDPINSGVQVLDGIRPPCSTQPATCSSTVSSFPYNEGFESGAGLWTQGSGDNLDWTNQTGGTPSGSTGPSGAAAGSRYMYIEASSPNYPSKSAHLLSPCFNISGLNSPELKFSYHMYGAAMGSLAVDISTDNGSTWNTGVWSVSGDQSNVWKQATVSLAGYSGTIRIRFNGVTGSGYTSDICIDGVSVAGQTTTTPSCANTVTSFPYSQSFESGTGDWSQASNDDLNWTNQSGGTPSSNTGPSGATAGSRYLYVEASSPNYPSKTARLLSPCYDLSGVSSPEFTFSYHMYGAAMGSLQLQASTNNGVSWSTLWTRTGNQNNSWNTAVVSLSAYTSGSVQLRFTATTGSSYTSDICIDGLGISGSTPAVTYCTPSPSNGTSDGDYIGGVALYGLNNLNSGATGGPAYNDYTAMSVDIDRGATHSLTVVEGGYAPDRYAAWIDYNGDGDFSDANEKLGEFTGNSVGSSHTIAFTVPSGTALGAKRMRVRCLYNGNSYGVDPCANGDYGETEDYTVNIVPTGTRNAMQVVAEVKPLHYKVYPNPTDGMVNLSFNLTDRAAGELTVVIYDLVGHVVGRRQYTIAEGEHLSQYDLSDYPAGVYQMAVTLDGKRHVERIVVQ